VPLSSGMWPLFHKHLTYHVKQNVTQPCAFMQIKGCQIIVPARYATCIEVKLYRVFLK